MTFVQLTECVCPLQIDRDPETGHPGVPCVPVCGAVGKREGEWPFNIHEK